jgi:hypothetical protein
LNRSVTLSGAGSRAHRLPRDVDVVGHGFTVGNADGDCTLRALVVTPPAVVSTPTSGATGASSVVLMPPVV